MQPLEIFGKRIRALRQEKNLSQQQLADLMFVTRKTVSNWENGNRMPDITSRRSSSSWRTNLFS